MVTDSLRWDADGIPLAPISTRVLSGRVRASRAASAGFGRLWSMWATLDAAFGPSGDRHSNTSSAVQRVRQGRGETSHAAAASPRQARPEPGGTQGLSFESVAAPIAGVYSLSLAALAHSSSSMRLPLYQLTEASVLIQFDTVNVMHIGVLPKSVRRA